jgi:hypothetical protein
MVTPQVKATFFWLGFSSDGTTLSAVTPAATIVRWNTDYTANPTAAVCAAAGRPLSRAEWSAYVPGLPYRAICP